MIASKPDPQEVPTVKKQRHCLRCNKLFTSTWAGHRLCDVCSRSNVDRMDKRPRSRGGIVTYKERETE